LLINKNFGVKILGEKEGGANLDFGLGATEARTATALPL